MEKKDTWIQRVFSRPEKRNIYEDFLRSLGLTYGGTTATMNEMQSMQLSTVYRAVEVISDSIATMPFEVIRFLSNDGWRTDEKHPASYIIGTEPNPNTSRYTFMKLLVSKVILKGNAFIEITRDKSGNPVALNIINEKIVIFKKKNGTLLYKVGDDERPVDGSEMIHVMNFSYDGLIGVSTLTHAVQSLGLSDASEKQAKGFFSGGANLSGILNVRGRLDKAKADGIKASWNAAFDTTLGSPNGIAVIEEGMTFTPVTVNPKDAQMLESRQFSVIEICRFFGISPTKAFSTEASSYNSVEAGQLAFLTDTLQPIVAKIENEFNRKLFRPSERSLLRVRFDIAELLRSDSDSMANYMMKMFQVGAYTSNEIRRKVGNPDIEGGNVAYVQVNMKPLIETTKQNLDE